MFSTHRLGAIAANTVATIASAFLFSPAFAAPTPIFVNNFNFESNAQADGAIAVTVPTGWTVFGGTAGVFNPTASGAQYSNADFTDTSGPMGIVGTMSGTTVAFLFQGAGSYFAQTTSHSIVAFEEYQLTVAVGGRTLGPSVQGASLEMWGGNSLLGSILVEGPANSFGDRELNVVSGPGDNGLLSIRLRQAGGNYADFDNVRLTLVAAPSSVPEPSSFALAMIAGLLACTATRRRRS